MLIDNIYVGDWRDARDKGSSFDAIITTAFESPYKGKYYYPLVDGAYPTNYKTMLSAINRLVALKKQHQNSKVLVHCFSGLSRSVAVIAGYMINKGWDVDYALSNIRTTRPIMGDDHPNKELVRLLKIYQKSLREE